MNINKLRVLIRLSSHVDIVKQLPLNLKYQSVGFNEELSGLSEIYSYLLHEMDTWNSLHNPLPNELGSSKKYFQEVKYIIDSFIYKHLSNEFYDEEQLLISWKDTQEQIDNITIKGLPFDHPITQKLMTIYFSTPSNFKGAYCCLTSNIESRIDMMNFLKGAVKAYELQNNLSNGNFQIMEKTLIPLNNFCAN